MSQPTAGSARVGEIARRALDLVGQDPRQALALAESALRATLPGEADEDVALAHRAAGWALRQLNDPGRAEKRLRTAVDIAKACGAVESAAHSRVTLALVMVDQGRSLAALAQLRLAGEVLIGDPGIVVDCQRADVLGVPGIRTRSGGDPSIGLR